MQDRCLMIILLLDRGWIQNMYGTCMTFRIFVSQLSTANWAFWLFWGLNIYLSHRWNDGTALLCAVIKSRQIAWESFTHSWETCKRSMNCRFPLMLSATKMQPYAKKMGFGRWLAILGTSYYLPKNTFLEHCRKTMRYLKISFCLGIKITGVM